MINHSLFQNNHHNKAIYLFQFHPSVTAVIKNRNHYNYHVTLHYKNKHWL